MILDNEDQRNLIINLIENIQIVGNLAQVKAATKELVDLATDVSTAEIKPITPSPKKVYDLGIDRETTCKEG